MNQNQLDYGDFVQVRDSAPGRFCPGQRASIVGFSEITNETRRDRHNLPIGTKTCLVEFPTGETIEMPERYLELLQKFKHGENRGEWDW